MFTRTGAYKGKFGLKANGELGFPEEDFLASLRGLRAGEKLTEKPEWVEPFFPLLSDVSCGTPFESVSHIDWLRLTLNGGEKLWLLPDVIQLLTDSLPDLDLSFIPIDKQMLGYPLVHHIKVWQDNQFITLGFIGVCADLGASHCGLCVDLSGVACSCLQRDKEVWFRLVSFFAGYKARITRSDIALDLHGSYCKFNKLTVPTIALDQYNNHIFQSDYTRNKSIVSYATSGDWSPITFGGLAHDDYNPEVHSLAGLTFNVGKRTSPRYWRIYEKGKQIIGSLQDSDYRNQNPVDQHWIRIECEFKRDKDGAEIPFELLLEPDLWLVKDRSSLSSLLDDYRSYLKKNDLIRVVFQDRKKVEKTLLLQRKVAWAKRQYGRLIKTLVEQGLGNDEIVALILRDKGLKDFIYDLS